MAQTVTVNLEVKDNTKTLKQQYKEAVVELQNMVAAYGETSQQALKAAAAAAELKDTIEDTNDLIATQKGEGAFIATGKAIQAASSGLAAYEGALGLIGVESEALQETMLKVQSAMALAQGLEGLEDAGRAFKTLGVTIQNALVKLGVLTVAKEADTVATLEQTASTATNIAATEAQAAANAVAGSSFKTMGTTAKISLNGIKGAIAATGIGLLVVALGTIVAYWDDIKGAVSGVSSELENNIELNKKQIESAQRQLTLFDLQKNSLKLQGKTDEEILKLRLGRLKLIYKEQQEDLKLAEQKKKLEVAAAERNKAIVTGIIRLNVEAVLIPFRGLAKAVDSTLFVINQGLKLLGKDPLPFKLLNEYISDFAAYASEGLGGMIFDPKAVAAESDKGIEEIKLGLAQTKSEIDGAELDIRNILNDSNKQKADDQKEADMSMTEYLDALEAKRKADITDARKKELQALDDQYEALYAAADKAGADTTELQKKHGEESRAINNKYDKLALEALNKKEQDQLKVMQEMDDAATKQFITAEEIKIAAMVDGIDKEAAIRKLAYDKEQIELQNKLDTGLITEAQFQIASRANYKAYQDGLDADRQAAYKKQKEDDLAAYEQKAALQNQYADIAVQAANLLKDTLGKSKAAQKTAVIIESAAGIAKMIIANKLANLGALATPQAVASGGITAVPTITANNISLGLGIAANVAATAKALKEIGGGGSAPSGGGAGGGMATGGGAGGGVMAPSFNVVGNNGLNQLAQLQQQPIKAYVVGSEVSTQQALDRNRITNAQL
jgi:hypothetical protein